MQTMKILGRSGSLRQDSHNRALRREAGESVMTGRPAAVIGASTGAEAPSIEERQEATAA
jgi:hypothetical protein